jgi:hypothetical protein
MLLDNDGTAVFIYTPPSLKSEGVSKAKDPRHASKMFKKYSTDESKRWATFHFTSFDNPTLSKEALKEITEDGEMTADAYRREILAEDEDVEQSWLVLGKFDDTIHKIKRFEVPKHWKVKSGHDFGIANPAALFVAEVKPPLPDGAPNYLRYGDYVAFAEYVPGGGLSPDNHVDSWKQITRDMNIYRSVGGNVTTEEEIRQLYRKSGWRIDAPPQNRVNAQLAKMIKLVEQSKFYVMEDLYNLLRQISDCMWVLDETKQPTNKIKDEPKYHLIACFRYLATILDVRMIDETAANEAKWD